MHHKNINSAFLICIGGSLKEEVAADTRYYCGIAMGNNKNTKLNDSSKNLIDMHRQCEDFLHYQSIIIGKSLEIFDFNHIYLNHHTNDGLYLVESIVHQN